MDNICNICGDILETNIVKIKCGHIFHYECIKMSYKYSNYTECPYCRQNGGKLIDPINICCAIIKTGKNKGNQCSNKINKEKSNKYCGKHLNYEK